MIPNTAVMTHQGSLGGEVTQMDFDPGATAHLMTVLSNLYSDSELAIIREYSTNARDSHIFAGQTRPIEVHTPNAFTNEFIVQDFGLGMDKCDIQNTFGKYGASTKRDSNEVAGCLGLGSKSALAYTHSFTVIGIKNGIKTHAVVYLGQDGAGRIEIVIEEKTDEPNGVTIKIPAKSGNQFDSKVANLFKYWDKGLVLVNGSEPVHFTDEAKYIEINPGLFVKRARYNASITVVMGGVPYRTKDLSFTRDMRYDLDVIYMADMGDVDFVPSREALNFTPRTVEWLTELCIYVSQAFPRIVQKEVDAADTIKEAMDLATFVRDRAMYWRGVKFDLAPYKRNYKYKISRRSCSSDDQIVFKNLYNDKTVVIVGKDKFSPISTSHRDKLAKYLDENNLQHITVAHYFAGRVPFLASEVPTIQWADVLAVRLPGKDRTNVKRTPLDQQQWEYRTKRTYGDWKTGLLDKTRTIVYINPKNISRYNRSMYVFNPRSLVYLPEDVVIVSVPQNRHGSFARAFPDALPWNVYIDRYVANAKKAITKDEYELAEVDRQALDTVKDKTNDPKITALYNSPNKNRLANLISLCNTVGISEPVYSGEDYMEKYPLINSSYPEESIEYVNHTYAARRKRKRSKS